jgi:hypothetical protein
MSVFIGLHPLIDFLHLKTPGRSDFGGGDLALLGQFVD